jgi:hypothetical protein
MANHFVARYDESKEAWVAVGIYDAISPTDANGLAAIATCTNGKYASWTTASAIASTETLQEISDSAATTF